MKRLLLLATLVLCLTGCATVGDVLDIMYPPDDVAAIEPIPICNLTTVGAVWQEQTCLPYDDGTYRWTK